MRIWAQRDLAAMARGRRIDLGWTQRDLASRASVSRKWISDFERGASGGDMRTVLRLLDTLGLVLEVRPDAEDPGVGSDSDSVDLDAVLARYLDR